MKKEMSFNETKEKMMKRCKYASEFMFIIEGLFIAIAIAGVLLLAITKFNPSALETIDDLEIHDGTIIEENISTYDVIKEAIVIGSNILIFAYLGRILRNTSKEGTPFTLKNVKYLKAINIIAVILFLFTDKIGLFGLVTMTVVYWMFKYGYFLQQESDETL